MSFRNTFVTDFIYQAGADVIEANAFVTEAFKNHTSSLSSEVGENGMGYYAGIIKTLSLGLEIDELELGSLIFDLEHATRVPFRLTILQESGVSITCTIEPRTKRKSEEN